VSETIRRTYPISLVVLLPGKTIEELRGRMREAIDLHLAGMREDGLPIPKPTTLADYVEAA